MPLAPETVAEIERIKAALPERRSALLPALKAAQRERGWLPRETMAEVAGLLDLDPNAAYMLATFYTMLHTEPVGHYTLEVCRSIVCYLHGCDAVIAKMQEELGVEVGGTSDDGVFSLFTGECLGDCPHAPMMRVNEDYVGPLAPETVGEVLDILRRRAEEGGGRRVVGLMADPAAGSPPNEGPLTFSDSIRAEPKSRARE
ncbi:MAG TPA: NADH-quinone oxidoreductase subunit NuoE [Thermomicrobiales bacterium]|nr:NADH-quinone oxidoreductase subunit NuoE [Thermomicrobiales bacterium]